MKKLTIYGIVFLSAISISSSAQESTFTSPNTLEASEKYGHVLNMDLGIGYYGYIGHSVPLLHADYEFAVAKNFTLAPFISYAAYQNYYYWGDAQNPYKNYYYSQTVMPVGVKGSYYFDQLLNAGPKWDFYLACSVGFVINSTIWENGYYGKTVQNQGTSAMYLDFHIGTEYHVNQKMGLLLDLSTEASTLGMAIHF
jgi:hypothetical protein